MGRVWLHTRSQSPAIPEGHDCGGRYGHGHRTLFQPIFKHKSVLIKLQCKLQSRIPNRNREQIYDAN